MQQNSLEGLLKYRLLGPTLRVHNLEGLDWVLITCFFLFCFAFYKFLDAAAAGLGPQEEKNYEVMMKEDSYQTEWGSRIHWEEEGTEREEAR